MDEGGREGGREGEKSCIIIIILSETVVNNHLHTHILYCIVCL